MKIFVLGKVSNITHWVEDAVAGFRVAGHEVRLGVTRNPALSRPVERVLTNPSFGGLRARWILRAIHAFQPDLILAIMPFVMPAGIVARVAALAERPPLFGWVGDVFGEADRPVADLFDLIGYTDTELLTRHRTLGFRAPTIYLPHAAPAGPPGRATAPERNDRMVFVASVSPRRRALLSGMREPLALYGSGWRGFSAAGHSVHARRVSNDELLTIYPRHLAALNIANEENVLAGLNQRNFTPCLSATPVLTDAQPDLARCFEPGCDVLAFRDVEELNALYTRLRADRAFAAEVGRRGQARVLGEHTYAHRLKALSAYL